MTGGCNRGRFPFIGLVWFFMMCFVSVFSSTAAGPDWGGPGTPGSGGSTPGVIRPPQVPKTPWGTPPIQTAPQPQQSAVQAPAVATEVAGREPVPLKTYWHGGRNDNFGTATAEGEQAAVAAGYRLVRTEGYVYPSQQPGMVPLKLFWHGGRSDNFTTATPAGEKAARDAGYQLVRTEGYVYPSQQPGMVPLKLFWHGVRNDNFLTATADGERDATAAGYQFIRIEGYVYAKAPGPAQFPGRTQQKDSSPAKLAGGQTQPSGAGSGSATSQEDQRRATSQENQPSGGGTCIKKWGPFTVCPNSNSSDGCAVSTGVYVRKGARVDVFSRGRINLGGGVPVGLALGVPVGPRVMDATADANGDDSQPGTGYPAPVLRKNSLIVQVAYPLPKDIFPLTFGRPELKSGKYYQGGMYSSFTSGEDGELVLAPNDDKISDNKGVCNAGAAGCGWEVVLYVDGESSNRPFPDSESPVLPKSGGMTPEQKKALDDCVKKKLGSTTSWGPAEGMRYANAVNACMQELGLLKQ